MISTLYKWRFLFLTFLVMTCVALWPGVRAGVQVDNSLSAWFLEGDPALVAYHEFQERFGNDEVVIIGVHDSATLLTPRNFQRLRQLSLALENHSDVAAVLSAGTTPVPAPDGLHAAHPLLDSAATPAAVRRYLDRRPTLRQQLFSPDYRTARLLVVLRSSLNFDDRRGEILGQLRAITAAQVPGGSFWLGGVGVVYAGLNALSQQDFGLFLGLGYALMFLIFWLLYRNLWLLLYTLGIVSLATYVTLGVYGLLGYRLNLMTVLLPVIIILLGLMDALHVVNERNHLARPGSTGPTDTLQALRNLARPCLATMLTTVAGFLALLSSPMAILRVFGVFAALGIGLCLVFTFGLGVLILPHAAPNPRTTHTTSTRLVAFYALVLRHRGLATVVSVVLIGLGLWGATRLRADTYTLGYLPANNIVVRDHQALEAAWGPYLPLELLVESRPGYSLASPAVLKAAAAFADSARTLHSAGQVFGFHSLYQAGLETRFGPRGGQLLGQSGAVHDIEARLRQDYPELLAQFAHQPTGTGRITVSGRMLSARQLTATTDTLLRMASHTLGPVARVRPAGYQPLYARITDYVTTSQTNSLLLSFLLVLGLVWVFVGNFRLALLALVPNVFPVVVLLGVMGWAGIALDTATASIAAIVLSFCTDDTVHFIHAYREQRRQGLGPAAARHITVAHVGPTIVLTSAVLFGGYAVMMLASLQTVFLFGLLTSLSIAAALYGEVIIFPLLLERFDRD
ncbi:MMPL family transporter [Hymenobacter taeanensis]|uniref:MMPL family transporter n=1 Tax=Hymenobacter taeanensis TaxID=2735321 RepID=A0A6M6BEF7_9BACT|nr:MULTISPECIES: MMPL family transporter [Hymenobacter]QJX45555.1 MMPL family transporter [Hymenobacter taeanensis]UOQ81196.1 MMPL family transporter [Hymenobacter sp. 5414T-23]